MQESCQEVLCQSILPGSAADICPDIDLRRQSRIFFRVFLEFFPAEVGTEVIICSSVRGTEPGSVFIHIHIAYRVHRHTELHLDPLIYTGYYKIFSGDTDLWR